MVVIVLFFRLRSSQWKMKIAAHSRENITRFSSTALLPMIGSHDGFETKWFAVFHN